MKTVPLHGPKAAGRVALVDDEDYELVSQYRWFVQEEMVPGQGQRGPYAKAILRVEKGRYARKRSLRMHVLIMGVTGIDHIDHDGLNNQRSNLRVATKAQNNHNQRPRAGHSSRYKGVTRVNHRNAGARGGGAWMAQIGINGKNCYLGTFSTEEDAALAYNAAAFEAWGEFAYLNDVPQAGNRDAA